MTIYITPFDPEAERRLPSGPSEDCGLPDMDAAVEMFGGEWRSWHPRLITYHDFAVSDFVLRLEP